MTDIMGEITTASQEQSTGIEQVSLAITLIDDVTQKNAVLMEETAAAAIAMQDQAASLAQLISVFKFDGGQSVMSPAPVARASVTALAAKAPVVRLASARSGKSPRARRGHDD